jgi:hypothetical protein
VTDFHLVKSSGIEPFDKACLKKVSECGLKPLQEEMVFEAVFMRHSVTVTSQGN